MLADCSDLRDAIGPSKTPDHNTLCRAFKFLIKPLKMGRALDLQAAAAKDGRRRDRVGISLRGSTMASEGSILD